MIVRRYIIFRSPRDSTCIMEGITVHVFSTDEKFKVQYSSLQLYINQENQLVLTGVCIQLLFIRSIIVAGSLECHPPCCEC